MSAKEARELLERDHARMDELLTRAARSVREDDRDDAYARWNELETALLSHFNLEEMFVVPELARANEKDAKQILEEHTRMRGELGDIAIAFELHTIRADAIDDFCARLRQHAAHEEELMYPLVEKHLPHGPLSSLLARLRQRPGLLVGVHDAMTALAADDDG